MAKGGKRKRAKEFLSDVQVHSQHERTPTRPARPKQPLNPKTEAQRQYLNSMNVNTVTFGIGPAGVGKTYVAARVAANKIRNKEIDKVILTRPAVEVGASIGFLPGEMEEKMAPYMASYRSGFHDEIGQGFFEYLLSSGRIEIQPLNFMQGISWDAPTMVLFDEAENATTAEMKMFLTRIGENAKVVIDGDPDQTMIKSKSGLIDGLNKLRYVKSVGVVQFKRSDIVRSGIVREILDAYDGDVEGDEEQFELPGFITGQ